jgi:hypothetical protein
LLNRLYIVIGVLAILVIAAAFIVPRFIQWGDYRGRMQAIASETLGAPVEIVGDIEFSLLPQPQLRFAEVRVGPADAPVLTVGEVQAEFSLIDFLRDRYLITRLVLEKPSLVVRIDASGAVVSGMALPEQVTTSNISVQNAVIVDGEIVVPDDRSGGTEIVDNIEGELTMAALRGPFSFQGSVDYSGGSYSTRISTSALADDGSSQLSLFVRSGEGGYSLTAEGALTQGAAAAFTGQIGYSQSPPAVAEGEELDAGRGDLVVTGEVTATTSRILLTTYTIVPDENRAATRLTGAAEIRLGATPSFNAVVSGGVLGLPPRDATADQATVPYELIRLISDLPVPVATGMAGTVGVDIAEVDLRAVALRNVRFDASTDGTGWSLDNFAALLPGNADLTLAGRFTETGGRPDFAGTIGIRTQRLDTLAQLWHRPSEPGPLFNLPGSFTARLSLVGETLSVSDAVLTIDQQSFLFSAEVGFAPANRHLNLRADLGVIDEANSAALFALLPEIEADPRFGVTFPRGKFEVTADTLTVAGLDGRQLAASGFWDGGVLALEQVSAGDLGGVEFDAKLTAFGSFARPEFSGTARIAVASADAPGLARFFDAVGTPPALRDWLGPSLPATLDLRLDAPSGEGGQGLAVTGQLGAADVKLDAQLGVGIVRALSGPMTVRLDLQSADPAALTAQLGLGDASLTPEDQPMHVVAVVEGTAANSFETTVRIDGGGESLAFAGNVVAGNLRRLSGNGNLQASVSDLSPLVERLGAGGIWLPAVAGSARVDFDGFESIRLREINASAGGERVAGELHWARGGETATVTGRLELGRFGPAGLLALVAGPAATMNAGSGYWPDGPATVGSAPRTTTGRVDVSVAEVALGDNPLLTDTSFALTWGTTDVRVRDFTGRLGGGTAEAEFTVCCAGPLPQVQFSGRLTLADVSFGSIVPAPVAAAISATVDAAAKFEGTGDSLFAALAALTGEGSYSLADLSVRGFDPAAFRAIASLEDVLEMEPVAVTAAVVDRLDDNAFTSPSVTGGFTVAGGVLRSPNVAIEGETARLFGSANVRLADLGLSGGFAMSPTVPTGPDGLLTAANAVIAANFGGTLPAPRLTYDVGGVVDTIMVSAYEMEVARLEALRAEDEARQREAAEERARMVAAEAARKAAEEEEKRRAEEEAARLAAEEEAARLAAEEAERQADEAEAARLAAEEAAAAQDPPPPQQQSVPQLRPGFNLNLEPANPF